MDVSERNQLRQSILDLFYDETGGDSMSMLDPSDVAAELQVEFQDVKLAFQWLDDHALLEIKTMGYRASMTSQGVDFVESQRRDAGTDETDRMENQTLTSKFKPTPWAFLSSVQRGMEKDREAARDACLRARILPIGMESWTAANKTPEEACQDKMRDADVVLLIVSYRYGSLVPGKEISYTEFEYEEAKVLGKPVLVFVASEASGVRVDEMTADDLSRLKPFVEKIGENHNGYYVTPDELGKLIYQALTEWRESEAS
jgi:hypothetical protein